MSPPFYVSIIDSVPGKVKPPGKLPMKKCAYKNLGCKVNAFELEAMKEQMEASGWETVSFDSPADVYVIHTCTVTNIADRKSRQMIRQARRQSPDAVVVAAGCSVQAEG